MNTCIKKNEKSGQDSATYLPPKNAKAQGKGVKDLDLIGPVLFIPISVLKHPIQLNYHSTTTRLLAKKIEMQFSISPEDEQ